MNNTRVPLMDLRNNDYSPDGHAIDVIIQGPTNKSMWISTTEFADDPMRIDVDQIVGQEPWMTQARLAQLGITRSTTIAGQISPVAADIGNTQYRRVSRRDVQYRLVIDFGADGRFISLWFNNRLLSTATLLESARRKLLARIASVPVIAQYIQLFLGPV